MKRRDGIRLQLNRVTPWYIVASHFVKPIIFLLFLKKKDVEVMGKVGTSCVYSKKKVDFRNIVGLTNLIFLFHQAWHPIRFLEPWDWTFFFFSTLFWGSRARRVV